VCININGENTSFFRTYKGLRQGDPLSPLLFNFVGDVLSEMLNLARRDGHVKGLAYHLIEGGISHLQYADDMVLLLDYDEDSFAAVKILLYCFEAMSGLKINYQKSEVFGVGLDPDQIRRVANIFNCNVGKFPMTYLGLPISMERIRAKDLAFVP
jgi:hypothetical protein